MMARLGVTTGIPENAHTRQWIRHATIRRAYVVKDEGLARQGVVVTSDGSAR